MSRSRSVGFAIFAALLVVDGAIVAACSSSSSPADDTTEGGPGGEGGPGSDAGKDSPGPKPDGDVGDAGGHCSKVTGECDIVLQDCANDSKGQKQECVVTKNGSALQTVCTPVQASQQLPKGAACCPPTQGSPDNPCLPGLSCGGADCTDGGPKTGRCAPACCPGSDSICGTSVPEGIAGSCDVTVTIDGEEAYSSCTYEERCKPFGLEKCPVSEACIVDLGSTAGSSTCVSSNGKQLGQPCTFLNDCADGLQCVGFVGDDGGTCRMTCLTPNSLAPFDAGGLDGGPGSGGCPTPTCAKSGGGSGPCCAIGIQGGPAWLSFCEFPDGG